ncbi:MAG: ABC transporter permease [Candidatus Acidiferrales bacterium]
MFLRILGESFARNPRRKLLAGAALMLGMAVTTAMLTVALDVNDRLAEEFRKLGANLLVTPQADTLPLEIGGVDYRPVDAGAYLETAELGKLRTIFWRLSITGFAPLLEVPAEINIAGNAAVNTATIIGTWYQKAVAVPDGTTFLTGVRATHPWWQVEGQWFADEADECVVGAALAQRAGWKPGDALQITAGGRMIEARVTGIVSTGGAEEESVLVPLRIAQQLAGRPGQFRRLLVSALTKPEDDFARRDPSTMTAEEYDRWYCTPYISSIAHQIREVLPDTDVRVMRRVAESEGHILTRVGGLMWLVSFAALVAAMLAVGATSATTVIERRAEIGLMKAIGASRWLVQAMFLAEQVLLAITGGALGYAMGLVLARVVGLSVFGVAPEQRLLLLPVVLGLAALVALAGSIAPLRRAARMSPAPILRGE